MRRRLSLLTVGVMLLTTAGALLISVAVRVPVLGATVSSVAARAADRTAVSTADSPGFGADGRYRLPVSGPLVVLRPFERPPTRYGPGHRGVDLAAPGGVVRAAGAGRVVFAGRVVDRGVVVLAHPDGIRTEYEPVAWLLPPGRSVVAGEPIGRVSGRHPECPASPCLHWGARYGDDYFDPLTLLAELGVVHLVRAP
jgi:murein DD-endopeptidase MepM/ murein hydrolase activator NlpD